MRFAIFPLHLSKVLRLPRKIILANLQIRCSKMQPLSGNQRPDLLTSLMNMSFAKCILADPLQMSHACHGFWKYDKTLTFCSLLTRCTIPCACHATRHLNFQKWREHVVFCTFWLRNVLRATMACTTRHLNFQKWSDTGVLCTFWLRNVLRATLTACTFSTSQLPKVVRSWCVLCILTSKCASRHNGVHFFISHLARCLRTCRFSEPTFRPSGTTNHFGKTQCFATFLPFRASASSFFWLFLFSDLLSSTLLFSLPLPSSVFHLSILSIIKNTWSAISAGTWFINPLINYRHL